MGQNAKRRREAAAAAKKPGNPGAQSEAGSRVERRHPKPVHVH